MWFLVVSLIAQSPQHERDIAVAMAAAQSYQSNAECMVAAKQRTAGLAFAGIHVSYLCMYHGEPDRQLRRSRRGAF
jgi:hypothetical protein